MKILHTESSCGWGGQELRVLNEAAGMLRRGHEVLIAAPMESRIFEEASRHGVPVRALPIRKKTLHGLRAMRALLKSMAPTVVNTHSSTDTWTVAGVLQVPSDCVANALQARGRLLSSGLLKFKVHFEEVFTELLYPPRRRTRRPRSPCPRGCRPPTT